MNIQNRWTVLVQETGGALPRQLKPFQIDTFRLLEEGHHILVSVPTGQGKSNMQLHAARLMGGET